MTISKKLYVFTCITVSEDSPCLATLNHLQTEEPFILPHDITATYHTSWMVQYTVIQHELA